jgi:hypothetical protein
MRSGKSLEALAMNAYRGVEMWLHILLNFAIDGDE